MGNKICSVDGCDEPARARGMCNTHYMRVWRRGLTTKKRGKRQAMESYIHKIVSDYYINILDRNLCKDWPFYILSDDTCMGTINGKNVSAHVYIAKMTIHKPEGVGQHMIAFRKCGNKKCVNPYHMEWRKFHPRQKLTTELKKRIALEKGTLAEIAQKYGIHVGTASKIRRGVYL